MLAELWLDLLPILEVMFISPARSLAAILPLHTPTKNVTALAHVDGMIGAMMVQEPICDLGVKVECSNY